MISKVLRVGKYRARRRAEGFSTLKKKLLIGMLMAAGSVFAYQVSVGIRIGAPPAARVLRFGRQAPARRMPGLTVIGIR